METLKTIVNDEIGCAYEESADVTIPHTFEDFRHISLVRGDSMGK